MNGHVRLGSTPDHNPGPVARPGASTGSNSLNFSNLSSTSTSQVFGNNIWSNSGTSSRDRSRPPARLEALQAESVTPGAAGSSTTNGSIMNGYSSSKLSQPAQPTTNGWGSNAMSAFGKKSTSSFTPSSQTNGLFEGSQPLPPSTLNGNARGFTGSSDLTSADLYGTGWRGHTSRRSDESSNHPGSLQSWPDGGSVHSPTEVRRISVANSDILNPFGSGSSSRNPSQPPSRGNDSSRWYTSLRDQQSVSRPTAPAHRASDSNASGVSYLESPTGTFTNGLHSVHQTASLGVENDFQALSIASESATSFSRQQSYTSSHSRANPQYDRSPQSGALYTPESAPSGYVTSLASQARTTGQRSAYTPTANEARQNSYFTPPGTASAPVESYNVPYDVRNGLPLSPAALNSRLQALLQTQYMRPSGLAFSQNLNNGYLTPQSLQQLPPHLLHQLLASGGMPFPSVALPSPLNALHQGGGLHVPHNAYSLHRGPPSEAQSSSIISPVLTAFKATPTKVSKDSPTPRQWRLEDVFGYVAEFCGDQNGSRFIQNKLEQANSEEKERVFNEIKPDIIQLTQDVFGNYVVQKFFDHGDQRQKHEIAAAMRGHVKKLSKGMYACRVVQKAIDHILSKERAALIKELTRDDVIELAYEMNGNHVIQKAIECIPAEHIQFMVDALTGQWGEISKHMYACRVAQRVLEYCPDDVKAPVIAELHKVEGLIDDQFGNYVTQHIIEYGSLEDQEIVVDKVMKKIIYYSTHKFASNVVEKCFEKTSEQAKHTMMYGLLQHDGLMQSAKDQFGNYVLQTMFMCLNDDDYLHLFDHMEPVIAQIERTTMGKHIVAVKQRMYEREKLIRSTDRKFVQQPPIPPPSPKDQRRGQGHHRHRSGGSGRGGSYNGGYGQGNAHSNAYSNGHAHRGSGFSNINSAWAHAGGQPGPSSGASPTAPSFSYGMNSGVPRMSGTVGVQAQRPVPGAASSTINGNDQ